MEGETVATIGTDDVSPATSSVLQVKTQLYECLRADQLPEHIPVIKCVP